MGASETSPASHPALPFGGNSRCLTEAGEAVNSARSRKQSPKGRSPLAQQSSASLHVCVLRRCAPDGLMSRRAVRPPDRPSNPRHSERSGQGDPVKRHALNRTGIDQLRNEPGASSGSRLTPLELRLFFEPRQPPSSDGFRRNPEQIERDSSGRTDHRDARRSAHFRAVTR